MFNPIAAPPADPDRTAVRSVSADPGTVDRTADSTDPTASDGPADAPTIPGYRVTGEIARGGMGRVYAAIDLTLDREVAVKTLLPGADPTRFVTESRITARLPHPGIPPVYALGTLADGGPFLAMKLVCGTTLAEQLKARPTPQHDLPRFVQVFEQIAQAVGFAHSKGVIHRDLKPLNVMVGAFGEVQVMDWGLARTLAPLSPGGRGAGGEGVSDSASSELTQAGAVMGTPGYMAPEQARGEAVDARTDVFALGSTLAAIITGRPAFVGPTAAETIQKAAKADLADVFARLDGCGADAELVALAKRCVAADLDARPADGRAVADEVAAYRAGVEARLRQAETERAAAVVREGEQRKRRRQFNLAAGVVTGVLLAGIAGTSVGLVLAEQRRGEADQARQREKDRADGEEQAKIAEQQAKEDQAIQRGKAEKAYAKAADVLDAMTADTTGDSLFTQAAVSPEQKKFLTDVLGYYKEFVRTDADTEARLLRQAKAAYRVGMIEGRLGRAEEAVAAFRQAQELFARLNAGPAVDPTFWQYQAMCHNNVGGMYTRLGKKAEAEVEYRRAITMLGELTTTFPAEAEYRLQLAGSCSNLAGPLADRGQRKEAEALYKRGIGLLQPLAAKEGANPRHLFDLALCHTGVAYVLQTVPQRLAEAITAARTATDLLQAVVAKTGGQAEYRWRLAESHNTLGVLLLAASDTQPEAAAAFGRARGGLEKLAAEYPTRPEYRQSLARVYNNLANVQDRTRSPAAGEELARLAVATVQRLADDHPDVPEYQRDLAFYTVNLANHTYGAGRVADRITLYDRAVRTLDAAKLTGATDRPTARILLLTYTGRAAAFHALGRYTDALADWDRAFALDPSVDPTLVDTMGKGRAMTRVRSGMPREAVKDLAQVERSLVWTSDSLYDIAAVYALAADQLPELRVRYGGRAMLMLRDAAADGFQDTARLRDDKDLDSLRGRDDFKKLFADLAKKHPPKREVLPPPRKG